MIKINRDEMQAEGELHSLLAELAFAIEKIAGQAGDKEGRNLVRAAMITLIMRNMEDEKKRWRQF